MAQLDKCKMQQQCSEINKYSCKNEHNATETPYYALINENNKFNKTSKEIEDMHEKLIIKY